MMASNNWTLATGIRHLFLSLTFRMLMTATLWGGLLIFLAPAFTSGKLVLRGPIGVVISLLPSLIIGFLMSWRLLDQAGFGGAFVVVSTAIATVVAIFLGSFFSHMLQPFADIQLLIVHGCILAVIAIAVVVKFTVLYAYD